MGKRMDRAWRIWIFILVLGISACGGGGGGGTTAGGGGNGGGNPPPTQSGVGVATELDSNTNMAAASSDMGMAANGDAIAVWARTESNGQMRVVARRYNNQGWGTVESIDAVDTPTKSAYMARIAMTAAGEAVVAWIQGDSALSSFDAGSIWTRTYDPTHGWGAPTAITPTNSPLPPMDFPAVAIAADGTRWVLWNRMQADYTSTSVYSNRLPAGATVWGSPQTLDGSLTEKRDLGLVLDQNSHIQAYWKHYTSRPVNGLDVFDLASSRLDATAGIWLTPGLIAQNVGEDVVSQVSAVSTEPDVVTYSWDSTDQVTNVSTINTRRVSSTFVDPTLVHIDGLNPALAASGGAEVLVGIRAIPITGSQGYNYLVSAKRYLASSNSWDSQWANLDPDSLVSINPLVHMNASGQAMAVWSRFDTSVGNGTPERLYANRFNGATWQTTAQVLAGSQAGDMLLRLKMDDTGKAIALWQRGLAIWANHFELP